MENSVSTDECIICLDNHKVNNTLPVNILHLNNLTKTCDCDYIIHPACLHTWLHKKSICIICNAQIILNDERSPPVNHYNLSHDHTAHDHTAHDHTALDIPDMTPPPPYILYAPNIHDHSSDSNSDTSSYYSQEQREHLNSVREQNSVRTCMFILILLIIILCLILNN